MRNFYRYSYVFIIATMVFLVSNIHSGFAQEKKGKYTKVDPSLLKINQPKSTIPSSSPALKFSPSPGQQSPSDNARTMKGKKSDPAALKPQSKPTELLVLDGYVAIEAIAVDDTQALLAELKRLGIKKESAFGGMVSGLLPVDKVDKLQNLGELRFARPTYMKTNIGSTTSQGDQAMFSDVAKSTYKITGEGNKIGVLSDSYNALNGAEAGVQSGDLPGKNNPNGYYYPVQVLEDLPTGEGSDEGRAMIEIIHDVAPGAELAFHSAFLGQASFAEGIIELADEGSDIIVDDIFYFAEPFFQDGIITQAVDMVSDKDVSYFSSAGNGGRESYEAEYRPVQEEIVLPLEIETEDGVEITPSTYVFHDFDPGPGEDIFQEIAFDPGSNSFTISFQWDEPFASVCEGCPGAQSDLDFFIALEEDTETIIYDLSSFFGNIDSDPVEFTSFGFTSDEPISLYLMIGKWVDDEAGDAPDPNLIKYVSFDGGTIVDDPTFSSTCVGHSNGESTISVGASFFFRNPLYFPEIYPTPAINDYSSLGGTPILFNTKGERINSKVRINPDITGPDAGNTTFFIPGSFIGFEIPGTTEPDEFPQFTGTSASAPHVAAVAALMNEINGERLDNEKINEVLMETATDMDDPFTEAFDEGYDFKTGAGFVDAQKAVASVASLPSVVSFTLINSTTDEVIGELGDRIELSQIEGGEFNIRADIIDGTSNTKSVEFDLTGSLKFRRFENAKPYAIFGDNMGDYDGKSLVAGTYTLIATPYTENGGEGEKGYAFSQSFEITNYPVESFSLYDADTDEEVEVLEDGAVINLKTTPNISIVANPEFEDFDGSMVFYLNDEKVLTENQSPYAIAGDNNGDLIPLDIEPGEYSLRVIVFTENNSEGERGSISTIDFTVVDELEVTALVLVESDSDQDLIALEDGLIIPLDVFPNINIRAEVNSTSVNSVEFRVNGQVYSVDNEAPFSLGEDKNGDYAALDLPPGEYAITAIPFGEEGALGEFGLALTVFIELENNFGVTDFVLLDAQNDTRLGPLSSGAILDLATLPALNIEAEVDDPEDVGSVEFILNDTRAAIENSGPYTIGGNDGNDFRPYNLAVGTYVLTAVPYSARGLRGIQGDALSIFFEVIDSDEEVGTENMRVVAYPNPVVSELNLSLEHPTAGIAYYAIMDNVGRTLGENYLNPQNQVNINMQPYQSRLGSARIFYVKVISDEGKVQTFPIKRE